MGGTHKAPWTNIVWTRAIILRHSFITWLLVHQKLPTKMRLQKYMQMDTSCSLCGAADEDANHLFMDVPLLLRSGEDCPHGGQDSHSHRPTAVENTSQNQRIETGIPDYTHNICCRHLLDMESKEQCDFPEADYTIKANNSRGQERCPTEDPLT